MKNLFFALICISFIFSSCKKDDDGAIDDKDKNKTGLYLGWTGTDNSAEIPVSVNSTDFFGNSQVPSAYDLTKHFPPIGDQGQFGTCVSWAVAYNYKTALEAMTKGWSASQLAQTSNQLSPKDLFVAIDDNLKSADCNGTNFEPALDVVLNRGVATVQTVPYTNLNGCNKSNLQASWTTEASGHKISNYRRINQDISTVKSYIADNVPVVLGARLGDNFMTWNSDQVISSHSGFDNVGIHAYHAMVIVGYDDSKGSNGAFRVVNSWGDTWGDVGLIWIDYNFLINDFCFGKNLYIATNGTSDNTPPDVNPNVNGSVDLAAWAFQDNSNYANTGLFNSRLIEYNIYNIGDEAALASSDWSIYYIYYNAYDANDYGFLFYNELNTSIASNTYSCTGSNCVINYDIPSGGDLAYGLFGSTSIEQSYDVPTTVNGYYYLLLWADADNTIKETDEQNNYFYTTNQYPAYFQGGVVAKNKSGGHSNFSFLNPGSPTNREIKKSDFNSAVHNANPNAYSPKEIKQMILRDKKSGRFNDKLAEYISRKGHSSIQKGKQ